MTIVHAGTPPRAAASRAPVYAVSLVDRRTGRALLTTFTRTPEETAAEVLRARDPRHWEVRSERIAATARAGASDPRQPRR